MAFLGNVKAGQKDKLDRPHLMWTMQNFGLKMEDGDGNEISSKAYLQKILELSDESSNHTTSYSDRFSSFFKSADTSGLPFPGKSFKDAGKLDILKEDELSEDYRMARDTLRKKILTLATPKRLGSTMLTGSTLSELMRAWVDEMANSGSLSKQKQSGMVATNPDALLQHIANKEEERLVRQYEAKLAKVALPCSTSDLVYAHLMASSALLAPYKKFASAAAAAAQAEDGEDSPISGNVPDFVATIQSRFDSSLSRLESTNEEIVRGRFDSAVESIKARIKEKMDAIVVPAKDAQVRTIQSDLLTLWSTSTSSFSLLLPALTSDYQHKVEGFIASAAAGKRGQNARKQREDILAEARVSLLPSSLGSPALKTSSLIHSFSKKARAKWSAVLEDMSVKKGDELDGEFENQMEQMVKQAGERRQEALETAISGILKQATASFTALTTDDSAAASSSDEDSAAVGGKPAVDEREIELIAAEAQSSHARECETFEQPADDEASPLRTNFMQQLAALKKTALTRNRQRSQSQCNHSARTLLSAFESDAARWWETGFEVYRREDTIRNLVAGLRAGSFCTGPAWRSAEIDSLFTRSETAVLLSLSSRSTLGFRLLCCLYLLALLGVLVLWRLSKTKWSMEGVGSMERWVSRLALPAAGVAAITLTLLPESDPNASLTPFVIGWLGLVAVVGARAEWMAYKRYARLADKSEV
jgi:hypothetical protein